MVLQEQTAYPTFPKNCELKFLETYFFPLSSEIQFAAVFRSEVNQAYCLLMLKSHQYLGYFPKLSEVPQDAVDYVLSFVGVDASEFSPLARSRQRVVLQVLDYLGIVSYGIKAQDYLRQKLETLVLTMSDPADLVNASISILIHAHYSLPAFSVLGQLVMQVRHQVHLKLYQQVYEQLSPAQVDLLEACFVLDPGELMTFYSRMKKTPAKISPQTVKDWIHKYSEIQQRIASSEILKGISFTKVRQFATEAYCFEITDMRQMHQPRRLCLLICMLHQLRQQTLDELVVMFIRMINRLHANGKRRLETAKDHLQHQQERVNEVYRLFLYCIAEEDKDKSLGQRIREESIRQGGCSELLEQVMMLSLYENNNYYPLLWPLHVPYRRAIFDLLEAFDFHAVNAQNRLKRDWELYLTFRRSHKKYIQADFDLSYISKKWEKQIINHQDGERFFHRQMLELCLLSYLSEGLLTTDLFVADSLQYGDYREQLLKWEACEGRVEKYCLQADLPSGPEELVAKLKARLEAGAQMVDRSFPNLSHLYFNDKGEFH